MRPWNLPPALASNLSVENVSLVEDAAQIIENVVRAVKAWKFMLLCFRWLCKDGAGRLFSAAEQEPAE